MESLWLLSPNSARLTHSCTEFEVPERHEISGHNFYFGTSPKWNICLYMIWNFPINYWLRLPDGLAQKILIFGPILQNSYGRWHEQFWVCFGAKEEKELMSFPFKCTFKVNSEARHTFETHQRFIHRSPFQTADSGWKAHDLRHVRAEFNISSVRLARMPVPLWGDFFK